MDALQIIALCLFLAVVAWLLSAVMRAQAGAKPAPVSSRTRKPDPPTEDPVDAKPAAPAPKKVPTPSKPMSPISELLNKAATAPQPIKPVVRSSPTPAKPMPALGKPAEPFRTAKPVAEAKAEPAKPEPAKSVEAPKIEAKTDDKLMAPAKPAKIPETAPETAPAPVLFQSQSGRKDTDGASLFAGLKDVDPPAKTAEAKPAAEAKPVDITPEIEGAPAPKPRTHTAELDDILHRIDKVLADAPPAPVVPVAEATKPDLPSGDGMMMMTESGRITNSHHKPERQKTDDDLLRRIDEALAMSNGTSSIAGTMVDPDFAAEASAVSKKDDALDKAETVSGAHAVEKPAEPAKVPDWARADALDSDAEKKDAQQKLF